jgi:DNA-binding SARP family transcriptional activator
MPGLRLELLGGFQLYSADREPIVLTARKSRALLAYLALDMRRAHARDRLAALLWPDSGEMQARTSLRQALTAVRRALGEGAEAVIAADLETVAVAADRLALDVTEFERGVELGTSESLQASLALYRGDLLDGVSAESASFEQWLAAERERLRALAVRGLARLLDHQQEAGLVDSARETATRLLAIDPLREDAHRTLMRLYLQQGRVVEALKQYQLLRQSLARELGVTPEPLTEQLYREMLQQRRTPGAAVASAEEPQPAPAAPPAQAPRPDVRHCVALFVDLHEFTAFTGETDPEEVHDYLLRYRARVIELARDGGGEVTNYIGARVMAVFGALVAHDNEAQRAAGVALAWREEIPGLASSSGRSFQPHIGVASGGLFVDRSSGTPVLSGEPVSLAARIMEQAAPGEILVSGWVRHALSEGMHADPVPGVAVRAAAQPVQLWRLRGWGDRTETARALVGRTLELRQIEGLLDACTAARTGHVLLVRGEAGLGKSRLMQELLQRARTRGYTCHRALVLDFGSGMGAGAIPVLARALIAADQAPERLAAAAHEAVEAGVVSRDLASFLLELLELPLAEPPSEGAPTGDRDPRGRGHQAVLDSLIRAATRNAPLLLVVEDVHWADRSTVDMLARAAAGARDLPVVLALTTRPDPDPIDAAWRAGSGGCPLLTLDLAPLTAAESRELAAVYGCDDQELVASCVQRAEGNPLFLDQLLRTAISGNRTLPSSIQSIVLARLDRLEADDRQALQAASILGQRFNVEAVENLTGLPCSCEAMVEKGLVRADGPGYIFSHALIHEAVYASLLRSRRQELHLRAAAWFAARDPVLHAQHLDASENAGAAGAYLRAAQAEADRHQYERALRLAERGLALKPERWAKFALSCLHADVLGELGHTQASVQAFEAAAALAEGPEQRVRALLGLASGLRILDRHRDALAAADAAEEQARGLGDPVQLAQIHFLRGNLYFPLGEIEACLAAHEQARVHAMQAASPALEARALGGLGDAHYLRGAMQTAHDYFTRCVALARDHGLLRLEASWLPMLAATQFYRLELDEALDSCRLARERASRAGSLRPGLVAVLVSGQVHACHADWAAAAVAAEEALALARRVGARRFEGEALGLLGLARNGMGERLEAERALDQACAVSRASGMLYSGPWLLGLLALVTADAAKRARALAEAERLLDEGCVSHAYLHFYEIGIEVALEQGDAGQAQRYAQALLDYTAREPLPFADFHAQCGLLLARLARGERTAQLEQQLAAAAEEARSRQMLAALPRLESARAVCGPASAGVQPS